MQIGAILFDDVDVCCLLHQIFRSDISNIIPIIVVTFIIIHSASTIGVLPWFHVSMFTFIRLWGCLPWICTQLSKPESMFGLQLSWHGRARRQRIYGEHSAAPHVASRAMYWDMMVPTWGA